MIGDGITHVGNASFVAFEALKEVILPSTLTSIGEYAFAYCAELTTIDLPATGTLYPEVAFAWTMADNAVGALDGNALTLTPGDGNVNVVMTVTATCGSESASKEITVSVVSGELTMADIVNAAYALGTGESLSDAFTLKGKITKVNTPYDASYENVTVTIVVEGMEDKPITCYRLKGDGADVIKTGDTITVNGILTNYNGTIEFTAGSTLVRIDEVGEDIPVPTDPAEILKALYKLEAGESTTLIVKLVVLKATDEYLWLWNEFQKVGMIVQRL